MPFKKHNPGCPCCTCVVDDSFTGWTEESGEWAAISGVLYTDDENAVFVTGLDVAGIAARYRVVAVEIRHGASGYVVQDNEAYAGLRSHDKSEAVYVKTWITGTSPNYAHHVELYQLYGGSETLIDSGSVVCDSTIEYILLHYDPDNQIVSVRVAFPLLIGCDDILILFGATDSTNAAVTYLATGSLAAAAPPLLAGIVGFNDSATLPTVSYQTRYCLIPEIGDDGYVGSASLVVKVTIAGIAEGSDPEFNWNDLNAEYVAYYDYDVDQNGPWYLQDAFTSTHPTKLNLTYDLGVTIGQYGSTRRIRVAFDQTTVPASEGFYWELSQTGETTDDVRSLTFTCPFGDEVGAIYGDGEFADFTNATATVEIILEPPP